MTGAPRHQPAHRVPDESEALDRHRPGGHQGVEQAAQALAVLGHVEAGVVADVDGGAAQLRLEAIAEARPGLLAGGIGATMRYFARRGRESDEKLRVGRWSIRNRD